MKAMAKLMVIVLWLALLSEGAEAQSEEAQQLLLDYQKLLSEKQLLNDLYKGYEILSKGYGAIRDLAKGNFDLHKAFLDGLLAVSPAVRNYKRVADIVNLQLGMVQRYKAAWALFQRDGHFSPGEVEWIGKVYSGLFDLTVKNLTTLVTILTDGALRADDAERLKQIDGLYEDMVRKDRDLTTFTNSTAILSLQRSASMSEAEGVRRLYGLH